MANISVTSACNQKCPYCFARDALRTPKPDNLHMELPLYEAALDFLHRSGIEQARLLGGEPTLHPNFPDLIDLALKRGLRLLIFSNGHMPEKSLRCLEAIPPEQLTVLVNIQAPIAPVANNNARQQENLRRLGPRALLGVNIYNPAVRPDFLVDLINGFRLSRTIRLGLAHPCLAGDNHFLASRYYETVGRNIATFIARFKDENLFLEFDCGFVPCMFPAESFALLGKTLEEVGQRCNPILDILSDGTVIPCYPLAELCQVTLDEENNAEGLRAEFERRLQPYRSIGIFRECSSCRLKQDGLCAGGCLAVAMQRLRSSEAEFRLPATGAGLQATSRPARIWRGVDAGIEAGRDVALPAGHGQTQRPEISAPFPARWIIPYIDQPLDFWERLATRFTGQIKEVYVPLPGEPFGSGRPKQPDIHLNEFLRHAPFVRTILLNPVVLPVSETRLGLTVVETVKRLADSFKLAGVTVSNLQLAERLRGVLPELTITASVLMDVSRPQQAMMLNGVCDSLVPASRVMRDLPALRELRSAFRGRIRLLVNEACLPDCLFRTQHFYEMGSGSEEPRSLCEGLLQKNPWLRLTGAWVLPQHLHFYDGLYDELKLAGRVTLSNPTDYFRVLDGYVYRKDFFPNEIGGGPASVLAPFPISEKFYAHTLSCSRRCHQCTVCRDYYETAKRGGDIGVEGYGRSRD